jgi:hypothetical protein
MEVIALPSYIDPENWAMFVEQRKAMKQPFTQLVQKRIVVKLMGFHADGYDSNAILEKSAIMGWRDVFADEKMKRKEPSKAASGSYVDPALAKILADEKKAAPMPENIRAKLDALRKTA